LKRGGPDARDRKAISYNKDPTTLKEFLFGRKRKLGTKYNHQRELLRWCPREKNRRNQGGGNGPNSGTLWEGGERSRPRVKGWDGDDEWAMKRKWGTQITAEFRRTGEKIAGFPSPYWD